MDNVDRLIKNYLKKSAGPGNTDRSADCLSEITLLDYLNGALDENARQALEAHIGGCGFCLSQLNVAYQAQKLHKQGGLEAAPQSFVDKAKSALNINKDAGHRKGIFKNMKKNLFLILTIGFFVMSFIWPKYFLQFLVATLILGIRWSLESEGARTLIMVLDSWRRHSHDKDDEISHRLKDHFPK